MGCGSSQAAYATPEPEPEPECAFSSQAIFVLERKPKFYPLTQADMERTGFARNATDYCGMRGTFYARQPETQAERLAAVAALARDAEAPARQSDVNSVLREAKQRFMALDPTRAAAERVEAFRERQGRSVKDEWTAKVNVKADEVREAKTAKDLIACSSASSAAPESRAALVQAAAEQIVPLIAELEVLKTDYAKAIGEPFPAPYDPPPDAAHPHVTDEHLRLQTAPTLEPVCAWLFTTCARGFNNEAEKAFGLAKQMRSFNQNTPAADGSWGWPEFEAYWRRTIEEAEGFQLGLNETYARRYDRRAAARAFAEFDWNHSQFIRGEEAVAYAEKMFAHLCADRPDNNTASVLLDKGGTLKPSLSAAHHGRAEAAAMLKRLALDKSGQGTKGDGLSFAHFDAYFTNLIQDVTRYKAGIEGRHRWRLDQAAAIIQAAVRFKKANKRCVAKIKARKIETKLMLSWPGWPDKTEDEHRAISLVQAMARAQAARKRIRDIKIELYRSAEERVRREEAATTIQAAQRGRVGRFKAAMARKAKRIAARRAQAKRKADAIKEAEKAAAKMAEVAARKKAAEELAEAEELARKIEAEQNAAAHVMKRVWDQQDRLKLERSDLPRTVSVAMMHLKEADKNAVLCALATASPPDHISRDMHQLTGAALLWVMCERNDEEKVEHLEALETSYKLIRADHTGAHTPDTTLWFLTYKGEDEAARLPRVKEWEKLAEKAAAGREQEISDALMLYSPDEAPVRIATCLCEGVCVCALQWQPPPVTPPTEIGSSKGSNLSISGGSIASSDTPAQRRSRLRQK